MKEIAIEGPTMMFNIYFTAVFPFIETNHFKSTQTSLEVCAEGSYTQICFARWISMTKMQEVTSL